MARQKADDPLIPVTFRLPASAVAKLTADKAWRERLRTLVLASLGDQPKAAPLKAPIRKRKPEPEPTKPAKLSHAALKATEPPPAPVQVDVQIGPRKVAYGALAKGRKP